jgi:hypothetical protein
MRTPSERSSRVLDKAAALLFPAVYPLGFWPLESVLSVRKDIRNRCLVMPKPSKFMEASHLLLLFMDR